VLNTYKIALKELNNALINGFDLASTEGPLMNEPMQGAVFILEDLRIDSSVEHVADCGPIGG
jgi:translation elongation factor EF-G